MKLKCVGGQCDGQIGHTHDDSPRVGEAVRVPIYPKEVVFDYMLPPEPEAIAIPLAVYIVDELRYAHSAQRNDYSNIMFLRPTNFSTFDAIQFQFNKV